MIQLNYFHFSILLFGWSNKKFHSHYFWATFINFNFWGQFVNFKNFEGSNDNFWKYWGANLQFLEIYWGQIEKFGKFEDQNANYNNEEI